MSTFCTKCEVPLPTDGSFVTCFACYGALRFKCTTIPASTYAGMGADRKERWRCDFCRLSLKLADIISKKSNAPDSQVTMTPLIESLRDTISGLGKKIDECIKSQTFICEKYEESRKEQALMSDKIDKLEKSMNGLLNSNAEIGYTH